MGKEIEKICNNCRLYNREKGNCRVAIFMNGTEFHMPVDPEDGCHMEELGIEIKQIRWWVEDEKGTPTEGNGTVKMEYPEDLFPAPEDVEPIE